MASISFNPGMCWSPSIQQVQFGYLNGAFGGGGGCCGPNFMSQGYDGMYNPMMGGGFSNPMMMMNMMGQMMQIDDGHDAAADGRPDGNGADASFHAPLRPANAPLSRRRLSVPLPRRLLGWQPTGARR